MIENAAELAKNIRDEVVTWPGVESGSRQVGNDVTSFVDVRTDDGRLYVITIYLSAAEQ